MSEIGWLDQGMLRNYVITVLFVSVINEKLYFLDQGLRFFQFIISSKSTLEKKRDSFVRYYYICLLVQIVYVILSYPRWILW